MITILDEIIFSSDWEDLTHPHTYQMKMAEFKVSLVQKNGKHKWVASYKHYAPSFAEWYSDNQLYTERYKELLQYAQIIKQYEGKVIYLPLNHCSKSPSCIRRAKAEAIIWLEELLKFRTNENYKINIDSEEYLKLNDENMTYLGHDNRSVWGTDFITTSVKDTENDKIYKVVYYVRFIPAKEGFNNHPQIEIAYHRENEFYFAMDLLNPYLDKIHEIVNNHYKDKYNYINYSIVHRQDYRTLVFE